ncbi:hypothetical protein HFN51_03480 [Rhizobium leguminosarum]|nr:hypothetical protein [Rhizobium leguminosarum]
MSNRQRIFRAAFLSVGLALGLPILFGAGPKENAREGEDPLRSIIFDFQTLIGGALAIGAAWWTVKTMEDTERSAAKRHAEQIDLTLRKDKLAVERAVNPQIDGLMSTEFSLVQLRDEMLRENTYRKQIVFIATNAWWLYDLSWSLAKLLELDQVKDGSKLFDGMLAYKLGWLHDRAIEIADVTVQFPRQMFHHYIESALSDRDTYKNLDKIYGTISKVADEIPVVVELMMATARKYGVE